jgi:Arc/MetJ-type ribon-helix-helix transcriptional regulator
MINYHTGGENMPTEKIAITMEKKLVQRVDALVEKRLFPSRSRAIQEAVVEKLTRLDKSRLARECAKLDKKSEQSMADEGLGTELSSWPEY